MYYIQSFVESSRPHRGDESRGGAARHQGRTALDTLSTPELNAKLQQAEAVKSAASAIDQKALTGARIQQKEAALNLWEKSPGRTVAEPRKPSTA